MASQSVPAAGAGSAVGTARNTGTTIRCVSTTKFWYHTPREDRTCSTTLRNVSTRLGVAPNPLPVPDMR
eukprot:3401031-Rhodomonas_salina.2